MTETGSGTNELLLQHLPDLVDGINPQSLISLLKEKDELSSTVLVGFRPTARAIKTPIVRQRMFREIERDCSLVDALRTLWIESNQDLWARVSLGSVKELKSAMVSFIAEHGVGRMRIAFLLDGRPSAGALIDGLEEVAAALPADEPCVPQSPVTPETADSKAQKTSERLHSDNAKLKRHTKELENHVNDLEKKLDDVRRRLESEHVALKDARQESAERQRQIERAEKTTDRLIRAREAAEQEILLLKREVKAREKAVRELNALKPASRTAKPSQESARPDWVIVASNLVKSGDYESARRFCEELARTYTTSVHAHLLLERICDKMGDRNRQISECLWLADYMMQSKQPIRACTFACRAVAIDPGQQNAIAQFRRVIEQIDLLDESSVLGAKRLIAKLKQSSPEAHRKVLAAIKRLGGGYVRAFSGLGDVLHPDKVFTLTNGKKTIQVSSRRIAEAIDSNEVHLVQFVRQGLAYLKRTRPTLYRSVLQNLDAEDRSYTAVLERGNKPVIVDGSNVAWHGNDGKPKLQNLLSMRSELRQEGFFPVYVYADASLQYQIDQQSVYLQLVNSGAVLDGDGGTDADSIMIESARQLGCPIITNDRMADWDPVSEVEKIRFSIDQFGVTVYNL